MNTQTMTQQQIRPAGMEILSRHPGLTGMIRFLQQTETGYGDYTKERDRLLGDPSIEELTEKIQSGKFNVKTWQSRQVRRLYRLLYVEESLTQNYENGTIDKGNFFSKGAFMNAIEFNTVSKDGYVAIPEQYRSQWSERKIRVILVDDASEKTKTKKPFLAAVMEETISGPEDFSENLDAYLNGIKHV